MDVIGLAMSANAPGRDLHWFCRLGAPRPQMAEEVSAGSGEKMNGD
ncbi:hypothetical protein [Bradyrhizobium japonicum]|nr:hypothetical protein [Bradyrhizobium japonicum]